MIIGCAVLVIVAVSICVICYVRYIPEKEYKNGLKAYNEQRYDEAVVFFQKAAEYGHEEAKTKYKKTLAEITCNKGKKAFVEHRYTEAVEHLQKAADLGHSEAQVLLGLCYFNGDGIIKNPDEAVMWFRKAAEQNNTEAQFRIGICYQVGVGVTPREAEALYWFQKAAKNGHAEAQFNLGERFFNGTGVTKDYAEAVKWLRLAAEHDHSEAKEFLPIAELHLKSQNGDANAQCNLGRHYENGYGVIKDLNKALYWYRKSAEQNYAEAYYHLGRFYENGRGVVASDLVDAFKMYLKASNQGYVEARAFLTRFVLLEDSSGTTGIRVYFSEKETFAMVKVESGSFKMSARDGVKDTRNEIAHLAILTRNFYIAQTEVTQAQWNTVMDSNPSRFIGDDLPVDTVTWNEAMEFCEKLNIMGKAPNGWRFTLPTETQWEYAARGGKKSRGYVYSGSNDIDEVAWYEKNSSGKTHSVAQKKKNELGLFDMTGNVCEWCLDNWQEKSDKLTAEFIRGNDRLGLKRAIRGGAFCRVASVCSVIDRDRGTIDSPDIEPDDIWNNPRNYWQGFRVALVPIQ